jgi:hypothetical protein
MLMKIAPVALGLALNACPFGTEEDVHGAYAVIEGTVTMRDGTPAAAAVLVACGQKALAEYPDRRDRTTTDGQGRYHIVVEGMPYDSPPANGAFTSPCRVTAPGLPPLASSRATVRFHFDRSLAETTRVDLVEGELDTAPWPQP